MCAHRYTLSACDLVDLTREGLQQLPPSSRDDSTLPRRCTQAASHEQSRLLCQKKAALANAAADALKAAAALRAQRRRGGRQTHVGGKNASENASRPFEPLKRRARRPRSQPHIPPRKHQKVN
jgi:hypothetical protein